MKTLAYLLGALLGVLYLLNPTLGVFELLPDNLPWIGNLDEAAATALVIACVRGLRTGRRKPEAVVKPTEPPSPPQA